MPAWAASILRLGIRMRLLVVATLIVYGAWTTTVRGVAAISSARGCGLGGFQSCGSARNSCTASAPDAAASASGSASSCRAPAWTPMTRASVTACGPSTEEARRAHRGRRVVRQGGELGERCVHLGLRRHGAVDHPGCRAGERQVGHQLSFPCQVDVLHELELWVGDAGLPEPRVEAAAAERVATVAAQRLRVGVLPEVEPRMRRLAELGQEVPVLRDQHSSGTDGAPHPPDRLDRVDEVLEQEP